MTVEELFETEKITVEHVSNIQEESPYWEKAGAFIMEKWEESVDRLSPKQFTWMHKILEELTERRIEGRLK